MTLFLVGGGPSQAPGPVYDSFVEEAQRHGTRVMVICLGPSDDTTLCADSLQSRWSQVHIETVHVTGDEGPSEWPTDRAELGGLIVVGSWSTEHVDIVLGHRAEIVGLVRGGVPYLGFGAGAQIVATHAITDESPTAGLDAEPRVGVARDGLGLIGCAIDVPTGSSSVLDHAVAAVLDGVVSSAVAIGKDAALIVDAASGRSDVVGPGDVHWLNRDGADVAVSRTRQAQPKTNNDIGKDHHDQSDAEQPDEGDEK